MVQASEKAEKFRRSVNVTKLNSFDKTLLSNFVPPKILSNLEHLKLLL